MEDALTSYHPWTRLLLDVFPPGRSKWWLLADSQVHQERFCPHSDVKVARRKATVGPYNSGELLQSLNVRKGTRRQGTVTRPIHISPPMRYKPLELAMTGHQPRVGPVNGVSGFVLRRTVKP